MALSSLYLRSAHDWEAIDAAWIRCSAVLREAGLAEAEVVALAMVARELLENAVKYGSYAAGSEEVRLSVEVLSRVVVISVANPVGEADPHAERVREAVRWISSFEDPFDAYTEIMERVSHQPRAGGLGLARIAAEGACALAVELADRTICVSAVRSRGEAGR